MPPKSANGPGTQQELSLLVYGLLGVSFVSTLSLLSVESRSTPLDISLGAFAVSIPILSLVAAVRMVHSPREVSRFAIALGLTAGVGVISSAGGVACLFWHFSWFHGVLFLAFVLTAFMLWLFFMSQLEE